MADNRPTDASKVAANAQTANPIGATGSDASDYVTKTERAADPLAGEADHDREQGQPGVNKTFSHAQEFADGPPPGIQDTSAPEGSVEALSSNTAASEHGNSKFLASLQDAKEKQEESGSTVI